MSVKPTDRKFHAKFQVPLSLPTSNLTLACDYRYEDWFDYCGFLCEAMGRCYPSGMDYLWTPWRYAFVTTAQQKHGCVFCEKLKEDNDERAGIVHRGEHNFIILNAFPYTSGHVMVVPYEHTDELRKLSAPAAEEMMALAQKMEGILRDVYHPDGINLGMNIGKAAGAGIAGHIHMHVLPRWMADANFLSVVGETRILPETLDVTWKRLKEKLT